MSPLLGSYGGSSEYAYRGTIDDWPDDFSFIDQFDKIPGGIYDSNTITITGINNRAIVRVSTGSSVSVNGGPYVIPTTGSPVFIKNNQTITVRVPTTVGSGIDFNKTYATTVSIGKKSTVWSLRTRLADTDPVPFTFTNLTGKEVGTAYTSNEVTISGLEAGYSFPATIISGSGLLVINGAAPVSASSVFNGDRVYVRIVSSSEYTDFPTGSGTKTVSTGIQVGNYSTSWSVSTRTADVFINSFDFPDVYDAALSSSYTAQSTNTSGITTTITGADTGLPLTTVISGCELRVEKPTLVPSIFEIRRDFSTANTVVYNGDRLTARVSSGSTYSETKIGIVTCSNITAQFIVTTRPRPVDTIPDSFSGQFTDLTNQARNATIQSNEITLTGMTGFGDQGTASITGSTGASAQFQVTRGSTLVRSYGSSSSSVQQGDKIKLRLTSSPDSNVTRTATFRVDGIDTNLIVSGTSGFQDDVWSVNTATRVCPINDFTLTDLNDVDPNTVQSTTFTAGGYDTDCGMIVSTSNSNSYLSVSGSTLTNNIPVSPGTLVTVYMTSGDYFATRSTNVTVSNTSNSVVPANSKTVTWTVNTVDDTRSTTVTLTPDKTSLSLGQSFVMKWTTVNGSSITTYSGSGFTPTTLSNSTGLTVTPTVIGTIRYSLTVLGPPSAANYSTQIAANPQGVTGFVDITVTEDTTPDSFTMNPSTRTAQTRSSYSTFTAQSSTNSSYSVTGLSPNTTVTASVSSSTANDIYFTLNGSGTYTSASVKNNDVIVCYLQNSANYSTIARGSLSIGSNSQSFSSTSEACVVPTSTYTIASGVVINTENLIGTYQNLTPFSYQGYISWATSPNRYSKCRTDYTFDFKQVFTSPGSRQITESGVSQAFIACVGGGGGGGGDAGSGNDFAGGGGGGGASYAYIPVAPGGQFSWTVGGGGQGATDGQGNNGGNSNVSYNGVQQISGQGGRAGDTSPGGAGGNGQYPGGDGQGDRPDSGGKGGGAGLLGGGTATPGANASGCTASGGGGGGGAQLGAVPAGSNPGPDATCNNDGKPGASYGGGGGGGARGNRGGTGGTGAARVNYSGFVASPTWNDLVNAIVTEYQNNGYRPPSGAEIAYWVGTFTPNPASPLAALRSSIAGGFGPSSRAQSISDFCGGTVG